MSSRISQRVRSKLKVATLERFGETTAGVGTFQDAAITFRLPDEYDILGWTWAANLSFPFDADGFCYWEFSLAGEYARLVDFAASDDDGDSGALGGVLDTLVLEVNHIATATGTNQMVMSDSRSVILPTDVRPRLYEGDFIYVNVHKSIPTGAAEFVKLTVYMKEW